MSHYLRYSLVICCLSGLGSLNVQAEPKVKYGEWETTVELSGMPIPMAPRTQRVCITKDNLVPSEQQEQDCTMKWTADGNSVRWTMSCANGAKGQGHVTYAWDTMHGETEITAPEAQLVMKSKMTGKWVAEKCTAE